MMSFEEAKHLIAGSSKYSHSFLISSLMNRLAGLLGVDNDTWVLVGLLHDLDYDETVEDRTRHGVITASRLIGKLPDEGLNAVLRHDYRSDLLPETDLDYSLILCDAVSIVLETGKLERPVSLDMFYEWLDQVSVEKPWIHDLITSNPILGKIELKDLLKT